MPNFKGFGVWLEIDGERLGEYRTTMNRVNNQTVCWVPCESGKEFSIVCSAPVNRATRASSTYHCFDVKLDGRDVVPDGNVFDKEDRKRALRYLKEEIVNNGTAARVFRFGDLEITDDDHYLRKGKKDKKLGTIEVTVSSVAGWRITSSESASNSSSGPGTVEKPQGEAYCVHRRTAAMGVTHCVRFGQEEELKQIIELEEALGVKVLCTFVFKYRHIDFLREKGLAPQPVIIANAYPEIYRVSPTPSIPYVGSETVRTKPASQERNVAPRLDEDRIKKEEVETGVSFRLPGAVKGNDDVVINIVDEEILKLETQLNALKEVKTKAVMATRGEGPANGANMGVLGVINDELGEVETRLVAIKKLKVKAKAASRESEPRPRKRVKTSHRKARVHSGVEIIDLT